MDRFKEQIKLKAAGNASETPQTDSISLRTSLIDQVETSRILLKESDLRLQSLRAAADDVRLTAAMNQITILERQAEEKNQIVQEKNKNIEALQDELFTHQVCYFNVWSQ